MSFEEMKNEYAQRDMFVGLGFNRTIELAKIKANTQLADALKEII